MYTEMSLVEDSTFTLFSTFMPRKREIKNPVGNGIFEIREYHEDYFSDFNPEARFVKWAAIEVTNFVDIPSEMKPFKMPSGAYAVFKNKEPNQDNVIFEYIFRDWLPKSGNTIDNRPHFDIFEDKNTTIDSNDNEEIWIPIKYKL